ncbi:MAG: hypothetical protein PHC34_11125 [Candidatus Gastranaerophilales bacterium]|nr:hypothetical protein [Candidatus Gastranaerophilales bacterium]
MNIITKPALESKFYINRVFNRNNNVNTEENSKSVPVNNGIYPAAKNYAHILNKISFTGLTDKIKNPVNYCNYCGGNIYTAIELNNKAIKMLNLKGHNLTEELEKVLNEITLPDNGSSALLADKKSKNSKHISFFENLKRLSNEFSLATCSELVNKTYNKANNKNKVKKLILQNLKPLLKTADHTVAHDLIKINNEMLLVEACDTCNRIKDKIPFDEFAQKYPEITDYMPEEKYKIAIKASSRENIRKLKEIITRSDLSEQARMNEINKFIQTVDKNNNDQNGNLLRQEKKKINISNQNTNSQKKIEDLPALIEERQILQQKIAEQKIILNNLSQRLNELLVDANLIRLKQLSTLKKNIENLTNRINSYEPELNRRKTIENRLYYLEDYQPSEKEKKKIEKDINKIKNKLTMLDKLEKNVIPKLNKKLSRLERKYAALKTDFKTPDELKTEIQSLKEIIDEEKSISEKLSKIKSIDEKNAIIRTQLDSLIQTSNQVTSQITKQTDYNSHDNKILDTIHNIDTFTTSTNAKNIVIESNESVELKETLGNIKSTLNERRKQLAGQIQSIRTHAKNIKSMEQKISVLEDLLRTNESTRSRIVATESERMALQERLKELRTNPPDREKITRAIEKLTEKLNSINSKYSEMETIQGEITEAKKAIASMTQSFNTIESDIYSLNQLK